MREWCFLMVPNSATSANSAPEHREIQVFQCADMTALLDGIDSVQQGHYRFPWPD